jgi:hypothetical protein
MREVRMVCRAVQNWVYAYGLSSCCIVAPLLLAFVALDQTASMLTHRAAGLELRYEFLSASVAEVKQIRNHAQKLGLVSNHPVSAADQAAAAVCSMISRDVFQLQGSSAAR